MKVVIVLITVALLVWRIFIRKPYGSCRWYQHEMGEWQPREWIYKTGKWIGDKEIIEKHPFKIRQCKKCLHEESTKFW